MLTINDLSHDPILVRKIKRMQQEKAREAEDSDAEDDDRELSVSQQPTAPAQPQIKISSSSRHQIPATQEPPRSSVVDDLGDPTDEEDE